MSTEIARLDSELKKFLVEISERRNKTLTELKFEDLKRVLKESLEEESQESRDTISLEELEDKFVRKGDIRPVLKSVIKLLIRVMAEVYPQEDFKQRIQEEKINEQYIPESIKRKFNPESFLSKKEWSIGMSPKLGGSNDRFSGE